MKLFIDIFSISMMFVFSYALGRKSESDNKAVIPPMVTWFSIIWVVGIMILLNLSDIIKLMKFYSQ